MKFMKRAIFLAACLAAMSAAGFSQSDIHKVDLKNFTYEPACAGEGTTKVRVRDGKYSKETEQDGYTDRFYFDVMAIEYGDVTGDGIDDAIVLTVCNTGGTGNFTEGFVYSMKGARPSLVIRIPGGDRADGGLRSITAENGMLVVEYNDPDKAAGACCPEGIVIETMRISGKKLVTVGKPIKRELYPKERISFAKGTSGKTFTVTIPVDDRKRYVLGARSGQTMSVAYSGEGDAGLRLLDDEAEVSESSHKINAVLKKNGDFTFELSNYGDRPITLTVTVRIR
jgi:hypothetical protein